ncbi:hypothetical protein ANOM_000489 [Aspergillus nomiae NRRL 13137]|uniref:Uncharacterized protein n=1 Tax=Aspergillus nomiae NRRL (strain ATCC 15546 / NRRL 13137 / CBS 260.88 / M93) TaxID=1509407 RepID=A0A0L1JI09_ASPN3|nr:uncharacterized protein ANOM_000489 [Aspergillus nomiae NRRL 13137]KNG91410.1 hypothetical protein ANOM_000489 [Aspergillus nomiae NRRL 13137]
MKIAVALSLVSLAVAVPPQRPPSPALSETGFNNVNNPNNFNNFNNVNNAQRPPSPALSDAGTHPAPPQQATPIPANIQGLDASFSVICGQATVTGDDIHKAISLGVSLDRQGTQLADFPHDYSNYENFRFLHKKCNRNKGLHRKEMTIVKGEYFNGRWEYVKRFRAIFIHDPSSPVDQNGRPSAIYCGTIYHPRGANAFNGCDVRRVESNVAV